MAANPQNLPEQISLGDYILERLRQLQVTHLFGVPGDFNLVRVLLISLTSHFALNPVIPCVGIPRSRRRPPDDPMGWER